MLINADHYIKGIYCRDPPPLVFPIIISIEQDVGNFIVLSMVIASANALSPHVWEPSTRVLTPP